MLWDDGDIEVARKLLHTYNANFEKMLWLRKCADVVAV